MKETREFICPNCYNRFCSAKETTFLNANPGEYWKERIGYFGKCPKCGAVSKEIVRIEDEKKFIDPQTMDKLKKAIDESFDNSKKTFLCPVCAHKKVCSKIEEPSRQCENFMDATEPQRYSSIYHFFQPVFDWIEFHYPSGEVKFIVDHNSAKMYIEHGPGVFSKEITDVSHNIKSIGNENKKNG